MLSFTVEKQKKQRPSVSATNRQALLIFSSTFRTGFSSATIKLQKSSMEKLHSQPGWVRNVLPQQTAATWTLVITFEDVTEI